MMNIVGYSIIGIPVRSFAIIIYMFSVSILNVQLYNYDDLFLRSYAFKWLWMGVDIQLL